MKGIRLAIVDDHQLVIDGLRSLLKNSPEFDIVLETTVPATVPDFLESNPVDILITDLQMPGLSGQELGKLLRKRGNQVKILALSMNGDGFMVNKMIDECDISGYLLKNIGMNEFVSALHKVASGGVYFSSEVLEEMLQSSERRKEVEEAMLSGREIEIIRLIEKEKSNKEIADLLFISTQTVETHRKNIYRKTKTNNLVGLLKYAYEHRLIDL